MARKGSAKNGSTTERRRRTESSTADWAGVSPELLQRLVCVVAFMGGAVRFGYSRDGGAFSIGIYGDGEPYTEYRPGDVELDDWLQGLIMDFE